MRRFFHYYESVTNTVKIYLNKKYNGVNIINFRIQFVKDKRVTSFGSIKDTLSQKLARSIVLTTNTKEEIQFSIIVKDNYEYVVKTLGFVITELINSDFKISSKAIGDTSIEEFVSYAMTFNQDLIPSLKISDAFSLELETKFQKMKDSYRYRL
jgi:ribosomal protein S3AE